MITSATLRRLGFVPDEMGYSMLLQPAVPGARAVEVFVAAAEDGGHVVGLLQDTDQIVLTSLPPKVSEDCLRSLITALQI
jgi:hypothetical protein